MGGREYVLVEVVVAFAVKWLGVKFSFTHTVSGSLGFGLLTILEENTQVVRKAVKVVHQT